MMKSDFEGWKSAGGKMGGLPILHLLQELPGLLLLRGR